MALLLISMALKLAVRSTCKPVPCLITEPLHKSDRPIFYFIGTSRVRQSISPAILNINLPDDNFINLGIPKNSFLYSCKAASNLLKHRPGKKMIFIELTRLALMPSDSYYFLLTPEDVREVMKQHLSIQCTSKDISELLFYLFNIHSDIKKSVYSRLNLYSRPEIGFMEDRHSYAGSLNAMLTPKSFTFKTEIPSNKLDAYIKTINELRKEANEQGSEIQFILPLTINNTSEFDIDMAVFAKLPENLKWSYSEEFLKAMHTPQYLADEHHLSANGAIRYSQELSEFIIKRFNVE